MDRICIAVLEKICSLAATGRYVVFSEDELFETFPEDEEKSEANLKGALKSLKETGYIDLKYSSGNLYCIAPVKRYEPEPEPLPSTLPQAEVKQQNIKPLYVFLSAFFGGALGSLIISLAFAFI